MSSVHERKCLACSPGGLGGLGMPGRESGKAMIVLRRVSRLRVIDFASGHFVMDAHPTPLGNRALATLMNEKLRIHAISGAR